jgi:hypothetical protein
MAEAEPVLTTDAEKPIEAPGRVPRLELPGPLHGSQPLAVYLQWSILSALLLLAVLHLPLPLAVQALAEVFPRWDQVAAIAALAMLALGSIERSRRDRSGLLHALHACTGLLLIAALADDVLLPGTSTRPGWFMLLAIVPYAVLHLLILEDWADGRPSPRLAVMSATFRDLATARWWSWASKAALAQRAREGRWREDLRERQVHDEAELRRAQAQAAASAALRKEGEDRLAAAQATEAAARVERTAAIEQQRADDAKRRAAEAEELRRAAELRVAVVRKESEELNRQADAAARDRARLHTEQLDAERRFLEAAMAAQDVAQRAEERRVDSVRARELLDRMRQQLAVPGDA